MKSQLHSSYEDLSVKQFFQLLKLCREFQPYLPFDDIVFLEVVGAAREFCSYGMYPFYSGNQRFEMILMKNINKIKAKYYFNGIKPNDKNLTISQINYLDKYIPRVKLVTFGALDGYRPVEKVLFLKIVRACGEFMRAKMSKDAEQAFYEKLSVVYNAMIA